MRFAIDAREVTGQPTGVGRVVGGILDAWPVDDDLVLYGRAPVPWTFLGGRRRSRIVAGPSKMPGAVWEQVVLPRLLREDGIDALFSPAYGMPLSAPCGVVVGMHDCACEATPEEFGWRQRRRRQWLARRAAEKAAFLLCGSEFSVDEIKRWYDVPAGRIVRADYGLASSFTDVSPQAIAKVRERYAIQGRTVLFVGAPLGRRDLRGLIETIRDLRRLRPDLDLCFVGPRADTEPADEAHLRWLGYVPESDLGAVYAAATVVAYPSTYEGFGFPVLEALACGTPVVASAAGSLPEIYGDYAWLVGDDRRQWSTALSSLLDDDAERQRRAERGRAWAQGRGWGPAARLLRHLLSRAAIVHAGEAA